MDVRFVGNTFGRFFAQRGTHLAALIAYFAMLSFVPLVFLALALLGLFGRIDESSALVTYLQRVIPGGSVEQIVSAVRSVQDNAQTIGIVGGVALLWSSVSLFSALESVFNILYERPNRSFLRGKALAATLMVGALVVLFTGLVAGTLGYDILRAYATDLIGNRWIAFALTVVTSGFALFLFLLISYFRLTNARLTWREVLPGSILGAVVLSLTLQGLPLFVFATSEVVALQALGTTFLLLVWLYVMANVIVFCAALNWELAHGRTGIPVQPRHVIEPTDPDTV